MGKSPTIKNLNGTNEEFTKFMNDLDADISKVAEKYRTEFDMSVKAFYTDTMDGCIQLESKEHRDYQLETEFSMETIGQVIKKTSDEIFGEEQKDSEKQKAVSALQNYTKMATSIAINFLKNALVSLRWKESAGYTYDIQHVSVGPGLTMHMLIVDRMYVGRGIIENKKVFQNFICYRLIFSKKKAGAEADVEYLDTQMSNLRDSNETYKEIQKQWIDLLKSKEYIMEGKTGDLHDLGMNLQLIMGELKSSYEEAYRAIQELIAKQDGAANLMLKHTADGTSAVEMDIPNVPLLSYLREV